MVTDLSNPKLLKELRAHRKVLQAQITQLNRELKHIDELEASMTNGAGAEPRKGTHTRRKTQAPRHGSFRDGIREVMKAADHPMRPAEVTKILKAKGVENPGTGDFNSRIATELYKLKLAGELKQTGEGYVLA